MRLLYLTLATILGVLSLSFDLIAILRFSTGKLIIALIFSGLFFLTIRQYRKTVRKDEKNIDDIKEADQLAATTYIERNREAFLKYTSDINYILINRHHFKYEHRPQFLNNLRYQGANTDYLFIKDGLRADQAAQIIFDEVVNQGNEFSPEIMQPQYIKNKLPKFHSFYKALFGSHTPSFLRVTSTLSIFSILFLVFYGVPQIAKGPYSDTFIVSNAWLDIGQSLTWTLTFVATILIFKNPGFQTRMKTKYKPTTRVFSYALWPLLIFCCFYLSLNFGMGKALNQIYGQEKISYLPVTKDPDTRKRSGRRDVDAYCVKLNLGSTQFLENEYCLQKIHYDKLPSSTPIIMKFHGIKSFFGYRIDGYYDGFLDMKSLLGKDTNI